MESKKSYALYYCGHVVELAWEGENPMTRCPECGALLEVVQQDIPIMGGQNDPPRDSR